MKQLGLGLAAAVLIDAVLIRGVLVPAVMRLAGSANWWLPSWLDRLLPRPPGSRLRQNSPSVRMITG